MKFNHCLILGLLISTHALSLDIYPQVSGAITYIKSVDDKVEKNETILTIDNRQANLKLQHLKILGKNKQQIFDDAKLEFEQTQELYDRMVSSHRDLDNAKIKFDITKRDLNAHNLHIQIQQIELEKYTLKSPIKGVVKSTPNLRNMSNINAPKVLMVIE